METLTKALRVARGRGGQRTVHEMQRDLEAYGAGGNCFDLAIWLEAELRARGIDSAFVASGRIGPDTHVALVAHTPGDGRGERWLCDLGDMWLAPLCIDEGSDTPVRGLFPGAAVSWSQQAGSLTVRYHRAGENGATQAYDLASVARPAFIAAADANQRQVKSALVEVRDFAADAHWEFDTWRSRWSRAHGLESEPPLPTDADWARRIERRAGMATSYAEACLRALRECGHAPDPTTGR